MNFTELVSNLLTEENNELQQASSKVGSYKVIKCASKKGMKGQPRCSYIQPVPASNISTACNKLISALKKQVKDLLITEKPLTDSSRDLGFIEFGYGNFYYRYFIFGPKSEYYNKELNYDEETLMSLIDTF